MKRYELRDTIISTAQHSGEAYYIYDNKKRERFSRDQYYTSPHFVTILDELNKMWENECKEVDWQDETEYISFTYSVLSDYSECYFFKINRMKYEDFYDQVNKIQFQRIKEIKEAQLKYFQFESFKLNIDVHNQRLAEENKIREKCNLKIMSEIITRENFFKAIDECYQWLNSFKFSFSDWDKIENCLNSSLKFELNHRFPL